MKIVVTGGSGKLGHWVVRELVSEAGGRAAHEVLNFDRAPDPLGSRARLLAGDVTDLGQVAGALAGADAVIHAAGIPTHSVAPNEVIFATNAVGTFNVHEAAWRLGIARVVTLSSEAVLGWAPGARSREFLPSYLPIDEDHPCGAQDAYGLSKIAAEAVARSYTAKCGMETVLIRPPWIASPEELLEVRRAGGRAVAEFGPCHYIEVRDLAAALRKAVERPIAGCQTIFVGAGESTVAEPLSELYPRLLPAIGGMAASLTGAAAWVSTERARRLLDWAPLRSWRDAPETRAIPKPR